jgi:ATP/maltotriose-dependent transcriptional regulator MalT
VSAAPGLVGRARERARLDAAMDELAVGVGTLVLIAGEPGIGKTALLGELVRRAEDRGFVVLEGRATEFERDDPFAVFAAALDDYLAALPPDCRADLPLADLAAVLPASAGSGGAVPDRLRSHSAVRATLGRLAGSRPVVLVLDDLHWADAASIDLFGYLLRHPPAAPVLLAAALRPAQAPERLRLAVEGYPTLLLGPLTQDEVADLLPGADDVTVRDLYADSGGNPFYLTALARAPHRASVPRDVPGDAVPDPVLAALSAELRALDLATQQAAWGASVAGDPFDADLAACAAMLHREEFLAALDRLAAADLVRPTDVPGRFRFRHPIVRRAVYCAAGHGRRLAAHGRVAKALADRNASATSQAHHVELSAAPGDEDAIALLADAGHATAGRAPAAAAHWFGAALRLLGDTSSERRAALLVPLALAAGSAGRFEVCRQATDELLELVPAEKSAIRVELVAFRAFVDQITGRLDDALALTRRELAALGPAQHAERAALLIELANNALVRCDYPALAQRAADALREATCADRNSLRAVAAAQVGYAAYNLAMIDNARAAVSTAARLVDEMSDDELGARLHTALVLSFAECNLEDTASAIAHATRGLELAQATGQVLVAPALYVTRALARANRGEVCRAIEDTSAAYEVSTYTGSAWTAAIARGVSSWVHIWRGDLDTALRHADEAIRIGATVGSALVTSNVGLYRAEALLEAGRVAEVADALLGAAGGADMPLLERPWRSRAVQILVRAALTRNDVVAARDWLERGKAELAGIPLNCRQADVLHAEAAVLLAEGSETAAREAVPVALAAVAAAERGGAPVEAGRARILAGIAKARSGLRPDGLAELHRAERDLDALGALRHRDQAVRELRRLGRRVHRRPESAAPGALSLREREIAELVAAGRTNRQIAAQLVISERTVETHVARILGKLDLRSRAAVGAALR